MLPPTNEPDLSRRFGGTSRLYGAAAVEKFSVARIAVVGIGGVGSWAVEALARSAVGHLTLIDMDHLSESNINRQLPALEETLGMAKVVVMRNRIRQINPLCTVEGVEEMAEPENLEQLLTRRFHHVIDCIDGHRNKGALIAHCRRHKIPITTTGGAGGRMDPTRIRVSDLSRTTGDPLLSRTRKLLRRHYGFATNPRRRFQVTAVWSEEPPQSPLAECHGEGSATQFNLNCGGFGSAMTVTACFGLNAAACALRRIAATPQASDPEGSPTAC